jgi:hypothetical protein
MRVRVPSTLRVGAGLRHLDPRVVLNLQGQVNALDYLVALQAARDGCLDRTRILS